MASLLRASSGAPSDAPLADRLGRPLRNLRVSVTDRCNLRCNYCMPEEEYVWLPRAGTADLRGNRALVDVFVGWASTEVRLTGGEPLLRRDLPRLVRMLAANRGFATSRSRPTACCSPSRREALRAAGLHRVTRQPRHAAPRSLPALTRRDTHAQVLAGIEAARRAGFPAAQDSTPSCCAASTTTNLST